MTVRSDALVLFGASGDLARRKLFPALYRMAQRGQLTFPVIGLGRSEWDTDRLRQHAREGIEQFGGGVDEDAFAQLARALSYVWVEYQRPETFEAVRAALAGPSHPLFYLAIPPSLFDDVIDGLAKVGLHEGARLVVEKPFGRDLTSARQLNHCLHRVFREEDVFRIDHYLGKQSVQNLLVFRFANGIIEPVWNRRYIDHVQVTMAERIGVAGRGAFYEEVGVVRDVVQNHLLEVLSFLAMEPPVGFDTTSLRDEKAKVLRVARVGDAGHVVRGQYEGYREEPGVDPASTVETFVAFCLGIDSWRWAGVPFYLRAGKSLVATATEVVVQFRLPPKVLVGMGTPDDIRPNLLRFRLGPDTGVSLTLEAKEPGEALVSRPVDLDVSYETAFGGREVDAYELLLSEALEGDTTLFARQDGVEAAWQVVEPLLASADPPEPYPQESWGPPAADALLEGRRWYQPASA